MVMPNLGLEVYLQDTLYFTKGVDRFMFSVRVLYADGDWNGRNGRVEVKTENGS